MNLANLQAQLKAFVREAGEDPVDPSPVVAWNALICLAGTAPMIDDLGDDFLRFEAVMTDSGCVAISMTRELTQDEGYERGSVGYSFELATAADPEGTADTLIESATEPDFLPLDEFVARVTATAAFASLLKARPRRSWQISSVDHG